MSLPACKPFSPLAAGQKSYKGREPRIVGSKGGTFTGRSALILRSGKAGLGLARGVRLSAASARTEPDSPKEELRRIATQDGGPCGKKNGGRDAVNMSAKNAAEIFFRPKIIKKKS